MSAAGREWLVTYALMSGERAATNPVHRCLPSYVINYNLGQDLVRQIEQRGGRATIHPALEESGLSFRLTLRRSHITSFPKKG